MLSDLDRLLREHIVPVRVADVGERIGDGRAHLHVRDVAVDLRHLELLPCRVGLEPAHERLGVQSRPVRIEPRVVKRVEARRRLPVVVQGDIEAASAPGNALGDSAVEGGQACVDRCPDSASSQQRVRGIVLPLRDELGRQRRVIDRLDAGI